LFRTAFDLDDEASCGIHHPSGETRPERKTIYRRTAPYPLQYAPQFDVFADRVGVRLVNAGPTIGATLRLMILIRKFGFVIIHFSG
jgi:hypothetical protein